MPDEAKPPVRERLIEWALSQGVSTVLLFLIVAGIWLGVPYIVNTVVPAHLASIKAGYVDVVEENRKAIESIERSHREEREDRDKRFIEAHTRDRELMREMLFNSGTKKTTMRPDELALPPEG